MKQRFTTSSHYDMTITQRVRNVLMEGGHYDLVAEQMVDGLRDIETMARSGLKELSERVKALELEREEFMKESGVIRVFDKKSNEQSVGWMKWGTRAALAGIGTALLGVIGWVLRLAWKGLHAS